MEERGHVPCAVCTVQMRMIARDTDKAITSDRIHSASTVHAAEPLVWVHTEAKLTGISAVFT